MPKAKVICSFCISEIDKSESYTVLIKAMAFEEYYRTTSCKKCLKNERVIDVIKKPKK